MHQDGFTGMTQKNTKHINLGLKHLLNQDQRNYSMLADSSKYILHSELLL